MKNRCHGQRGRYEFKAALSFGMADAVRSPTTLIPAGFTTENLASGEADLAVQQVNELLVVLGIAAIRRVRKPVTGTSTSAARWRWVRPLELLRPHPVFLQTSAPPLGCPRGALARKALPPGN